MVEQKRAMFLLVLIIASFLIPEVPANRLRDLCNEKPMELREEDANVIFTGTVRGVFQDYKHPEMQKAQVEVKRIIKGDNVINSLPGINPYKPWVRKVVMVDGIGDPHICHSHARRYDSRIFMLNLNKDQTGELKLNSSLVRLTLTNLEIADAAVKGKPMTTTPAPVTAPCEHMYCAYGAQCRVDKFTNEARCECIEVCPDVFAPVCGSDGATYTSECQLRATSCGQQRRIKVKWQGECNVHDPCADKRCSFGAECKASHDGTVARCECPAQCDAYGDSRGSKPVCGTDGKDYGNECEMRRAACSQMKDIGIKYMGRCDPCNGYQCDQGHEVCKLDENRQPTCHCNQICTFDFSPVCASDGRTYSNECMMEMEACKKGKDLKVLFRNECSQGSNPCAGIRCTGPEEECHVDRSGNARCSCPPPCELVLRPVCGSDGNTYDNECEMRRASCLAKTRIAKSFDGECTDDPGIPSRPSRPGNNGPCARYECLYGSTCVVKDDRPTCQCPSCSSDFQPVCGTNGISYNNECKLRAETCEQQRDIGILYEGLCTSDACKTKKCDFYSFCETDSRGEAKCVCPSQCMQVQDPVCGIDGVTYNNKCELEVASCQKQLYIIIASQGPCDLCANVKCRNGARCEAGRCVCPQRCPDTNEPVCATDGETYASQCEMSRYACTHSLELEVVHSGECVDDSLSGDGSGFPAGEGSCDETTCRYGGTCDYDADGDVMCNCNFNCKAIRSPVCGSDGKQYGNECHMREEACNKQMELLVTSMDNCEELEDDELCDGNAPMINPLTNREYDCGSGRETCPAGSYCHKVARDARCCQEERTIRSCHDTQFGCCPDGKTSAPGPNNIGCPSTCQCQTLGSYSDTCNPQTRQCTCKPGVGGQRCDRCEPGFWGFPRLADGRSGCTPCQCDIFGSVRDDCEQMTGRCVCKPGIMGDKCNICPNRKTIGPNGCTDSNIIARSCSELTCHHGATCQVKNSMATCMCPSACPPASSSMPPVCGSDGQQYGSECQLRMFACRRQEPIEKAYDGPCRDDMTTPPNIRTKKTTRHVAGVVTKDLSQPTPPAPEYGYIGDFCKRNIECVVARSYCKSSICTCMESFIPSADSKRCTEPMHMIPSFIGKSYLRLKKFHHGNSKISIDMMFRTLNMDAILLYSAQTMDGTGDYISLAVVNGYVEFRYNLGSGAASIKSTERVQPNHYHRIVAQRSDKEGILLLDDGSDVGVSPGNLKSLNLGTDIYLGYVPDANEKVYEDIGTSQGLVGCIESLEVAGEGVTKQYDLIYSAAAGSQDIVNGAGIGECSDNPCRDMPCRNGATCSSDDDVDFKCTCVPGYSGKLCEFLGQEDSQCNPNPCENSATCIPLPDNEGYFCSCSPGYHGDKCQAATSPPEITVPEFHGDSYVTLPINDNVGRTLSYQVWFLSTKPDGALIYSVQEDKQEDVDFISLAMVNGHLQFRFDLGGGIANITTPDRVSLNAWHNVSINRTDESGSMVVDNGAPIRGMSKGTLRELNLSKKMYLGGYPGNMYHKDSGITVGLDGAIQRAYENGRPVDSFVAKSVEAVDISQYNGPPCSTADNPCKNGGQCMPKLDQYKCRCAAGYIGEKCDKAVSIEETDKPVKFDGNTFHRYPNKVVKKQPSQHSNAFQLRIRTKSRNGLLLLQHKSSSVDADYLAMAIDRGYVQVSYNLGKQSVDNLHVMSSTVRVDDGEWHTIDFAREKRQGTLSVDNEEPILSVSTTGATQLDTDGSLWLGGSDAPPRGLPAAFLPGFIGCMESVAVDGEPLDLAHHRIFAAAIEYCDSS